MTNNNNTQFTHDNTERRVIPHMTKCFEASQKLKFLFSCATFSFSCICLGYEILTTGHSRLTHDITLLEISKSYDAVIWVLTHKLQYTRVNKLPHEHGILVRYKL